MAGALAAMQYPDPYSMVNALLAQGVDPNSAVDQVNKQFNLPAGQSLAYYAPGAHGAGSGAVIGLPSSVNGGGYLATGADGQWGYNKGDSGSAAATPAAPAAGNPLSTLGNYAPPPAPVYTPYTPTTFTAPTAAQAAATPGQQYIVDQSNQALQRSAAAKGGLLSGGTLKDIDANTQSLASTNYQNVFNNAYNTWSGNTNAGLSAAGLNAQGVNQQFQNTYQPSLAAYQTNLGAGQFQQNYGLAQQNFGLAQQGQFWNQGLQSNQNAFYQYNTNQTNAFDQWYKTAQLGNPGNPYS